VKFVSCYWLPACRQAGWLLDRDAAFDCGIFICNRAWLELNPHGKLLNADSVHLLMRYRMKDEFFIQAIANKGKAAKEKVRAEFSNISFYQLNWKPSPESWSIAQCLHHLMIAHSAYFPVLKKITEGNYHLNLWQKISPFSSLFGKLLKNQLQEEPKIKIKAPKKIQPATSALHLGIIDQYCRSLDTFVGFLTRSGQVELDRTIITSPTIRIITYNLRDAFQFLLQHEHRHINQGIRVKKDERFPVN
jgi:uncharacterized damage-inducible protein DinB